MAAGLLLPVNKVTAYLASPLEGNEGKYGMAWRRIAIALHVSSSASASLDAVHGASASGREIDKRK